MKKDLDFVPTPKKAAELIIAFAAIKPQEAVLEPSAGEGHLAKAIRDQGHNVVCGELDVELAVKLRGEGFSVFCGDFLSSKKQDFPPFQHIIMTPPFGSGLYEAHVRHAYDLLDYGGVLVTLLPQDVAPDFKEWAIQKSVIPKNMPEGSFPASKTNVSTLLWRIKK